MSNDLERPVLKMGRRKQSSFDPDALAASSDLVAGSGQFENVALAAPQVSIPVIPEPKASSPKSKPNQRSERITIYVTPEVERAFRVRLAQEGKSMTSVLNEAIQTYLKQ